MLLARCRAPSLRLAPHAARTLAGPVKIYECDIATLDGPSAVERTEPLLEMGVLYPPGVPSALEGTLSQGTIVVDGLVAKTGGEPLGSPLHMIKLSAHSTKPAVCKYTGLRFVSKQALERAAQAQE